MVSADEFAAACGRCVRLLDRWEQSPEHVEPDARSRHITDQVEMATDVNRVHAAELRQALGERVIDAFDTEIERPTVDSTGD